MSMTSTMLNIVDYGAAELKRIYQEHVKRAFSYAAAGHLVAAAIYLGVVWYITRDDVARAVRFIKYQDLGPPPSLTNQAAAPQIQVSAPTARPTIGIPEPVPDAEVSSETTIATQTEMSQMTSLVGGEGMGEGSVIQVEQPVQQTDNIVVEEDKLPDVGEFIPVEEQPVPVEQPKPVYPEIARRAGIEGVVFIQILVDKTGKVRDVKIVKGPEMFHESAKEAAWKSVWRPAIQNQKPVAVWVAYPIRFTLK
jgi:protein TonB